MNRPSSVSLGIEHYKIHFYKSDALPVTKLTASITKKWNLKTIDKNQMTHYLLQMTSRTGSLPISTRSQAGDTRSVVPRQSTRSACFACSSAVDRTRFSRLSPKLMMVFDKYPSHPYNIIMRHSRYKSVLIDTTNSNQWNRHHQQTNTQFFYRPDALSVAQTTVSQHCWLGDRKGIWPVKKLGVDEPMKTLIYNLHAHVQPMHE